MADVTVARPLPGGPSVLRNTKAPGELGPAGHGHVSSLSRPVQQGGLWGGAGMSATKGGKRLSLCWLRRGLSQARKITVNYGI